MKPPRDHLYPIMFWGRTAGMELVAELFVVLFTGRKSMLTDPRSCVREDIPRDRREQAATLLANGKVFETYLGDAQCRICNKTLGNKDLYGYGFIWPERAEHYVLEHNVWVPGLWRLLERSEN